MYINVNVCMYPLRIEHAKLILETLTVRGTKFFMLGGSGAGGARQGHENYDQELPEFFRTHTPAISCPSFQTFWLMTLRVNFQGMLRDF